MYAIDERFEILRDGLRQAATHSSCKRTRWAAQAALEQPNGLNLLRVTHNLSCSYARGLLPIVKEFWGRNNA